MFCVERNLSFPRKPVPRLRQNGPLLSPPNRRDFWPDQTETLLVKNRLSRTLRVPADFLQTIY